MAKYTVFSNIISGSQAQLVGITGSLLGTASYANASFTASSAVSSSYAFTASSAVSAFTASSAISAFTASSAINSTNALTASSADSFVVRNSLTASAALINGTIIAQTLIVSVISSSVEYSSGSNRFGSLTTDQQTFTGSVNISGSLNVNGRATIQDLTGSLFGTSSWATNFITSSVTSASYAFTASSAISSSYSYTASSAISAFTASSSVSSSLAVSASYAFTASSAISSSQAQTASYVLNAISSSYAFTASSAVSAFTASSSISSSLSISASYAFTASSAVSSFTASSAISSSLAISSSYAFTASSAVSASSAISSSQTISASYAFTASSAISASYASNGGVTQILAGSNISISPTNGLGAVTINSTSTISGAGTNTTASFSNLSTWTFNHNLNSQYVIVQTIDSAGNQIIPENVALTNLNTATITFPTAESGIAIASLGGVGTTAATASYVTPYETAWTAYTPVWTAASVNPAINNGTIQGYYKLVGKTCFVRGNVAMGSTTTFGTGEWYISMPFTASNADSILMSANLLDNTTAWYNATVNGARAGFNYKAPIQYQAVGGTADSITPTAPFTWTNSDRFIWNGSYEIA